MPSTAIYCDFSSYFTWVFIVKPNFIFLILYSFSQRETHKLYVHEGLQNQNLSLSGTLLKKVEEIAGHVPN